MLPEILKGVRQRWWVLVMFPLLSVLAAFAISSTMTEIYRADTTLLIEHQMAGGTSDLQSIQAAERRTQTFSRLITSRSVLEPTIADLDLERGLEELRQSVSVSATRETQLVTISVEDPDPDRAAQIADEIGRQFADFVSLIQTPVTGEQEEDLNALVSQLDEQISDTREQIDEIQADGGPESGAEEMELAELEESLERMERSLDAIALLRENVDGTDSAAGSQVFIVEQAAAPGAPVSPRVMMNMALAGFLGLLLGGGAVVGLTWRDDKVKTEQDVRRLIDRPVLGKVPTVDFPDQAEKIHSERSMSGEIFRQLRTNLQFTMVDRSVRSFSVTSINPGDGKTTIASNLAIVLAQGGQRVMLVDADMRRPQLHTRFHRVRNDRGLSNLLLQSPAVIEDVVQSTTIKNLKVLTSGPLPPNPPDLLGSSRMRALVSALEETADIVIFDAPPLAITDSLLLSSLSDGMLVVIRAGQNRTGDVAESLGRASQTNVPILGIVLNGLPRHSQEAYRVYQQYYSDMETVEADYVPASRTRWLRRILGRGTS